MSSYRIEITRDALKALGKLDKPIRRRLQTAIDALQYEPRPAGVIALQGVKGVYRIRIGDYRVLYTIRDSELVVLIVDLGHRREIYDQF